MHDGSSELLANSLRAGVPVLVLPSTPEAMFWASQVEAIGIAPKSIALGQVTPKNLYSALRQITSDREMHLRADALGEHIRAESGAERCMHRVLSELCAKPQ